MRKMKLAGWGVIATTLLMMSAGASAKTPVTCTISAESLEGGGALNVSAYDPDSAASLGVPPLKVLWDPPGGEDDSVELAISYKTPSLNAFGASNGGMVKFAPGIGGRADQFLAIVSTGGAELGRFRVDPDFGAAQGDFVFSADDRRSDAVIAAINAGKRIEITILKDGAKVTSDTFDTSSTPGRDRLLAQARHLVETSDPSVCRPG
jgi:hypothetical protein